MASQLFNVGQEIKDHLSSPSLADSALIDWLIAKLCVESHRIVNGISPNESTKPPLSQVVA